jgi:hypothetical protein
MRDFRQELAHERCWDRECEELWRTQGAALVDAPLQNREELIGLCEFIEEHKIRSYLEIGCWTGKLVTILHRLFAFEKVAVCDQGLAKKLGVPFSIPSQASFFEGSSHSQEFLEWRSQLGHFDLVMIDGDHSYAGVRRDFEINQTFPHRFLAFHDIVNRHPDIQVARLWNELTGAKVEIIKANAELGWDHSHMGIGIWSAAQA